MAQTARATAITENGSYDTTNNNSVTVSVSGGGGLTPYEDVELENGGFYSSGQEASDTNRVRSKEFISCTPGSLYIVRVVPNNITIKLSVSFYAAADKTISRSRYTEFAVADAITFTPQSGENYFRVLIGRSDNVNMTVADIENCKSAVLENEGKVVHLGELVAQTSGIATQNGTVDTTLINSLTVNVGGSGGSLPSSYQEVEYLVCNGAEWIHTDLSYVKNSIVNFKAERSSSATQTIIGHRESSYRWDVNFEAGSYGAVNACSFYIKDVRNTTILEASVIITTSGSGFNYGSYDYSTKYPFYGKLYTLRVYQPSDESLVALIAKFVPCRRISDSVLGFYEIVNDVFYTNAGSGAFTAGPDLA